MWGGGGFKAFLITCTNLSFAEKYQVKNFDWDSDEYEVKTDVVLAAG